YFLNRWHYHIELEVICIVNGEGTQFIGDHISRFSNGDILLIGSNLPHYWRCGDNYFRDIPELFAEAKAIYFHQGFMGEDFMNLPENINISLVLKKAQQGLLIKGETKEKNKTFSA
ncbi:MAG: AraC family ligand binding domain-containing protein, partial [Ferruginibacter sp.]|nr:AraC family ligand binding domain-containing protein [Ferruginibacter sp.]